METDNQHEPSLWHAMPSSQARRSTIAVLIFYVILIGFLIPWAQHPGFAVPTAVTLITTGIVIADCTTGLLLLSQPEARRGWYALGPACAFIASAVLGALHMLTFPGAILPDRPVIGGTQLAAYCFVTWRITFAALMASAALVREPSTRPRSHPLWLTPALIVVLILMLFTWAALNESALPVLIAHGQFNDISELLSWANSFMALFACVLFWKRGLRGSRLRLWLALSMATFCGDLALGTFSGGRFTWGWYAGRFSGLISAGTLLVFFLSRFTAQQRQVLADALALAHNATALSTEIERRSEAEARLLQSQKMETIGQLTGGIAHDFNNLLTPIIGGLDVLRRRPGTDDRALRLIDGALQSAERARTLIQRLLAFSRRQLLDLRPVRLGALIEGMSDLLARSLGPQIKLELDLPPDLPSVRLDPNQFELALLNLAINARDAMNSEGILRITACTGQFPAEATLPARACVRIDVTDTGAGMDPDTLRRAIEPFFTTKGKTRGTGLGLSMVHGLAGQLGGELELASTPGAGTTATLRLPIWQDSVTAETAAAPTAWESAAPIQGQLLLLVDDEELVRAATAAMLTQIGYSIVQAASGAQALQLVRSGLEPAALVTDFAMPRMTGVELAEELRRLKPNLPTLVVTGYATLADRDSGGLPRLTKPFRQAELANAIAAILHPTNIIRFTKISDSS